MFYEIVMFFSPFHDFSAFLKFLFSSGIPMKFFNKIFRFLLSCAMFYLNFFPWPFHEICNIVTGSGWVNFIEHLFKNKPLFHLFYLFRSVSSQYKHYHQFSIVTLFIKTSRKDMHQMCKQLEPGRIEFQFRQRPFLKFRF